MKCKTCKSSFVDNSRSKTKKYCSRKCFIRHYQTTEKCKQITYNYNNSEAGRKTKQKWLDKNKGTEKFKLLCIKRKKEQWQRDKNNPETMKRIKAESKRYREKNKEKIRAKKKIAQHKWYWEQGGKKIAQLRAKDYRSTEIGRTKENAKTNLRRARLIHATPKWITDKDKKEMQEIYKSCPKGYHVDHIVPLRGKNVCGLHVPNNLRVVSAYVNMSKGNRFDIRLNH
jgi:hypothetical protein